MLKVLMVDDHAVVREGLARILTKAFEGIVVGEASNESQALDQVRRSEWDLVLLDISIPGRGGLDILRQLKQEKPRLPVLVLSVHGEEEYGLRSLRAGASGYITKGAVSSELIAAIRKVLQGGKYVGESLAELLAYRVDLESLKPVHESLSDRELQVMRMIARGKTQKEISRELSVSPKTVSTFRGRVLQKMNMKGNVEIALYARDNGLID